MFLVKHDGVFVTKGLQVLDEALASLRRVDNIVHETTLSGALHKQNKEPQMALAPLPIAMIRGKMHDNRGGGGGLFGFVLT